MTQSTHHQIEHAQWKNEEAAYYGLLKYDLKDSIGHHIEVEHKWNSADCHFKGNIKPKQ